MPHEPVIDAFEFARTGCRLSGVLSADRLLRLRDALAEAGGEVAYELTGLPEYDGRPALRLRIRGALPLRCQRCLGTLEFCLERESVLLLFASEAELDAVAVEAEGPEAIVGATDTRVVALAEDEVLLALPYAPRHDRCEPALRMAEAAARQSPFAELERLLRKN